ESGLADGVDLEQERPTGKGPSAPPVDQPLGGGGQDLGRGRRGHVVHVAEESDAELVVRGQERVLLAGELLVERRPRYPGGGGDVGHGRLRVAVFADHVEHRVEDPLTLRRPDLLPREAVGTLGEAFGNFDLTGHVRKEYST